MNNINTQDIVDGVLLLNTNGQAKEITYPTNGRKPTKWGQQYDRATRCRIVHDINAGKITAEQISATLDIWKSSVEEWTGCKYTKLRKQKGLLKNGSQYDALAKSNIAKLVTSGQHSLEYVAKAYSVYTSTLARWCRSNHRFYTGKKTVKQFAKPVVTAQQSSTDRLLSNQDHAKIVLNLLLNESPLKAQAVAKALLAQ